MIRVCIFYDPLGLFQTLLTKVSVDTDYGRPFEATVTYDSSAPAFRAAFDGRDLPPLTVPHERWNLYFASAAASGEAASVDYLGFAPRDFDPALPVGAAVEFRCPAGHVMSHDWSRSPRLRLVCRDDGNFTRPGFWPVCVDPNPPDCDASQSNCTGNFFSKV